MAALAFRIMDLQAKSVRRGIDVDPGIRVRDENHHLLTLLRGTEECRHDDEVVAVQRRSNLGTSCYRWSVYESY